MMQGWNSGAHRKLHAGFAGSPVPGAKLKRDRVMFSQIARRFRLGQN
jgi:hypothetical protein